MVDRRILERIKKCVALASSTNRYEAEGAMLTARRLMAKYKIDQQTLDQHMVSKKMQVKELYVTHKIWIALLAKYVAIEYGCYIYREDIPHRKAKSIKIVGLSDDISIACDVFNLALKVAKHLIQEERANMKKTNQSFKGKDFAYGIGFVEGLQEKFKKDRIDKQGYALILRGSKDAEDYIRETHSYETYNINTRKWSIEYEVGYKHGKAFSLN